MRLTPLLFLLLLLPVPPAAALELNGTCQVEFVGTTTFHGFEGKAECAPFTLDLSEEGRFQPAELSVPVVRMTTDNDARDQKMREMLEGADYPEIVGHFDGGALAELRGRVRAALQSHETVPLQLKIRDTVKPVPATVTRLIDSAEAFSVDLEFPVSLKAYDLKAPSVLGLLRVNDEIRVHVSLHLPALPGH